MKIVINESQYIFLVEQTTPPVQLSREEQIKLNKEKLELKKKAAEELKLKTIQKKDSIAKAWDEKRAPELKKAEELHKKYLDAWLAANPGKTEKDYSKYLEKQKKLPDSPSYETQDPSFKSTDCGISKQHAKDDKKEFKNKR
jgi:hypothetical protein